ncbi:MAG: universal stress protein [Polyangiaceae bacterium]
MTTLSSSATNDQARLVVEYQTATAGAALCGATLAGRRLVLASNAYLLRLVPDSGRIVDRLETFPAAGGLAYDGNRIWQYCGGRFEQLDSRTGLVVQTVSTEMTDLSHLTGLECLEGGLLVLHDQGHSLSWVHIEQRGRSRKAVVEREARTEEALHGLCWIGDDLWSSTGSELVRIDPRTAEVRESLALPGSTGVCDIAGDRRGRFWCVDGVSGDVRVFDLPARSRPADEDARPGSSTTAQRSAADALATGSPALAAEDYFDRILVPVDFSAASRQALAAAFLLRERVGSEVHVFHLAEQGANAAFLSGAGAAVGYDDVVSDAQGELLRFVENLFPGQSSAVTVHAGIGNEVVRAIDEVVREVNATLVLLAGSPHRTLFRTRMERIAREIDAAVLVLPVPEEGREKGPVP